MATETDSVQRSFWPKGFKCWLWSHKQVISKLYPCAAAAGSLLSLWPALLFKFYLPINTSTGGIISQLLNSCLPSVLCSPSSCFPIIPIRKHSHVTSISVLTRPWSMSMALSKHGCHSISEEAEGNVTDSREIRAPTVNLGAKSKETIQREEEAERVIVHNTYFEEQSVP